MSEEQEDRDSALQELEEGLTGDYSGIFESMNGFPGYIRLSDPPFQDVLPNLVELTEEFSTMQTKKAMGGDIEDEEFDERRKTYERLQPLVEENPMVGLRGVRLSLYFPGLLKAQLRAIAEGLQGATERAGSQPDISIIVPFCLCGGEIAKVKAELKTALAAINKEHETPVTVKLGAGLEIPRAVFVADSISAESDFVSFNTNELTETVFGLSREIGEKQFLSEYRGKEIIASSPFEKLDEEGVGELLKIGIETIRAQNAEAVIGIAGENLGDDSSVRFLFDLHVGYISCEASQLPMARLATGQAALAMKPPVPEPEPEYDPEPEPEPDPEPEPVPEGEGGSGEGSSADEAGGAAPAAGDGPAAEPAAAPAAAPSAGRAPSAQKGRPGSSASDSGSGTGSYSSGTS
jgi:pyruvate,orthophosphate dikinase